MPQLQCFRGLLKHDAYGDCGQQRKGVKGSACEQPNDTWDAWVTGLAGAGPLVAISSPSPLPTKRRDIGHAERVLSWREGDLCGCRLSRR